MPDRWYGRNLTPGRTWSKELGEHIREAQAVIVVLSPSSVASDYVRKEIRFAEGPGKRIIPVFLHTCEVPLPLPDLQWIDARDGQDPLPVLQPPEKLPAPPPPLELRLSIRRVNDALLASLSLPEANLNAGPFHFAPPARMGQGAF